MSYSPQRAVRKMIPRGKSLSHTTKCQLIKNFPQFDKPGINVGIVDKTYKAQKHLEHLEMAVIVKNCSDHVNLYMSSSASFFLSFFIKLICVWCRYFNHSCSIEHRTSLFLDFPFQVVIIVECEFVKRPKSTDYITWLEAFRGGNKSNIQWKHFS